MTRDTDNGRPAGTDQFGGTVARTKRNPDQNCVNVPKKQVFALWVFLWVLLWVFLWVFLWVLWVFLWDVGVSHD